MNELHDLLSTAADDSERLQSIDVRAVVALGERRRVRRRNLVVGGVGLVTAVTVAATALVFTGGTDRSIEPAGDELPAKAVARFPGVTTLAVTPVRQEVPTARGRVLNTAEILDRCAGQVAAFEREHQVELGNLTVLNKGTYREGDAVGLATVGSDGRPKRDPGGLWADVVCGLKTPDRSVQSIVNPGPDDPKGLAQRCSVGGTYIRPADMVVGGGEKVRRSVLDPEAFRVVRYAAAASKAEVWLRDETGTEVVCSLRQAKGNRSWGVLNNGNEAPGISLAVEEGDPDVEIALGTGLTPRAKWLVWGSKGRYYAAPVRNSLAVGLVPAPGSWDRPDTAKSELVVLDGEGEILSEDEYLPAEEVSP